MCGKTVLASVFYDVFADTAELVWCEQFEL